MMSCEERVMKVFIAFLSLFFAIHNVMFVLYALPLQSSQQVYESRKKILDILIPMSKEIPAKKDDVYKVLDNVNSICQTYTTRVNESSALHERQQKEITDINSLKNENTQLKQHIAELQNKLNEAEKTIQEYMGRLHKAMSERDDLELQVHASVEKEKTMANHVKVLQETFQEQQSSRAYAGKRRGTKNPAFPEDTTKTTK